VLVMELKGLPTVSLTVQDCVDLAQALKAAGNGEGQSVHAQRWETLQSAFEALATTAACWFNMTFDQQKEVESMLAEYGQVAPSFCASHSKAS